MKCYRRITITTQPAVCWVCQRAITAGALVERKIDRYDNLIDDEVRHAGSCPPFATDAERDAYTARIRAHR